MVESSSFADDLSDQLLKETYNETDKFYNEQKEWHFINIPFLFNGNASNYNLTTKPNNITKVIPELRQIIK